MEKLWCIINLKHLTDPHWFSCRSRYGQRLDKQHGPTAFYADRKQAEEELFRLSDIDGEFALFELVGYVVDSPVTIMAKHIQAPDFDELPF